MFDDAHNTNWAENYQFFLNQNNPTNFEHVWRQSYYLYTQITAIEQSQKEVPFDQVADFSLIDKLGKDPKYASQKDEYEIRLVPKTVSKIEGESEEILTNTIVIHFFPNSWDLNKTITKEVDGCRSKDTTGLMPCRILGDRPDRLPEQIREPVRSRSSPAWRSLLMPAGSPLRASVTRRPRMESCRPFTPTAVYGRTRRSSCGRCSRESSQRRQDGWLVIAVNRDAPGATISVMGRVDRLTPPRAESEGAAIAPWWRRGRDRDPEPEWLHLAGRDIHPGVEGAPSQSTPPRLMQVNALAGITPAASPRNAL